MFSLPRFLKWSPESCCFPGAIVELPTGKNELVELKKHPNLWEKGTQARSPGPFNYLADTVEPSKFLALGMGLGI